MFLLVLVLAEDVEEGVKCVVWLFYFEIFFCFVFCVFVCVREREGSYPLLVLMCVLCWVRILYCHGSNK